MLLSCKIRFSVAVCTQSGSVVCIAMQTSSPPHPPQAIFDGSQGWVNALLFVLLSREGILRMKRFYLKLKHFSQSCRSACRGNPKPNVMDDNNCSVELADSQSLVPP